MTKSHDWGTPEGFLGIEEGKNARFSVLPVAFDSTASYRTGARRGPVAIIEASKQVELYDMELEKEVIPAVETLQSLEAANTAPEENCKRVQEAVAGILKGGKIPVTIGGDHSVAIGSIACFGKDVVVVSIDAHGDLRDEYEGSKFSHACVMRRAFEDGKNIIEIGTRAISEEEAKLIKANPERIMIHSAAEIRRIGIEKVAKKLASEIKGKKVYLSIDIDGFDPAEAPGTGTPEPGGLSWWDGLEIIRTLCSSGKLVGFDMMEVSPTGTDNVTEFFAAKMLFKIMAYLEAKR